MTPSLQRRGWCVLNRSEVTPLFQSQGFLQQHCELLPRRLAQGYDELLFLTQRQPPPDLSSVLSISSPVSSWVVWRGGMSSPRCRRQQQPDAGWRTRDAS